jgi:hypothetical protein
VPSHGTSVPKGKVDVFMSVHINDAIPMCCFEIQWKSTGPFVHPRHGHTTEEIGRLTVECL